MKISKCKFFKRTKFEVISTSIFFITIYVIENQRFLKKILKTNSYRFFSLAFWHHFKIFVQYRSCHKTYPMYVKTVQIESTLSNIDFLKIWQQITKESLLKTCLVFNEIYRGKKDILLACSLLIWSRPPKYSKNYSWLLN